MGSCQHETRGGTLWGLINHLKVLHQNVRLLGEAACQGPHGEPLFPTPEARKGLEWFDPSPLQPDAEAEVRAWCSAHHDAPEEAAYHIHQAGEDMGLARFLVRRLLSSPSEFEADIASNNLRARTPGPTFATWRGSPWLAWGVLAGAASRGGESPRHVEETEARGPTQTWPGVAAPELPSPGATPLVRRFLPQPSRLPPAAADSSPPTDAGPPSSAVAGALLPAAAVQPLREASGPAPSGAASRRPAVAGHAAVCRETGLGVTTRLARALVRSHLQKPG